LAEPGTGGFDSLRRSSRRPRTGNRTGLRIPAPEAVTITVKHSAPADAVGRSGFAPPDARTAAAAHEPALARPRRRDDATPAGTKPTLADRARALDHGRDLRPPTPPLFSTKEHPMFTTLHIPINERAVLVRHGLPVRALAPGKHTVWGAGVTIHRLNIDELVLTAPAAIRAALPAEWYREVTLGARERAVVFRDGRPVKFLRPGVHRVWAIDPTVEIRVVDVDQPPP